MKRLKIVGVMGASAEAHEDLARTVGRLVAESGCHLLTGGCGGVMAAVSEAFCSVTPRDGRCIGVLRGSIMTEVDDDGREILPHQADTPNPWVEIPIYTHLPLSGEEGRDERSRNHINVLSADILIALPGSSGTCSEVTLRLDYGRKVILYLGEHDIAGHPAEYFRTCARTPGQVLIAGNPEELGRILRMEIQAK